MWKTGFPSDEGLTLEKSAYKLYGDQFTLSTQLIKKNDLVKSNFIWYFPFPLTMASLSKCQVLETLYAGQFALLFQLIKSNFFFMHGFKALLCSSYNAALKVKTVFKDLHIPPDYWNEMLSLIMICPQNFLNVHKVYEELFLFITKRKLKELMTFDLPFKVITQIKRTLIVITLHDHHFYQECCCHSLIVSFISFSLSISFPRTTLLIGHAT